jgi:putative ABC transport system permease protein
LQFLLESLLLALLGGAVGVVLDTLVTAGYATRQHWQVVLPLSGVAGRVSAAPALGAVAGPIPRSAPPT